MKKSRVFASLHRVLSPVVHGCEAQTALGLARALRAETVLLGIVRIQSEESVSAGAARARQVRVRLRGLAQEGEYRARSRVRVSREPWAELEEVIRSEDPDLMLLEWPCHLDAFDISAADALSRPPCDVGLVRGPLPSEVRRVLVPIRGGPHAELALRIALGLRPRDLTAVHLIPEGTEIRDAPYRGLEQVLRRLPDVRTQSMRTTDPAQTILDLAPAYDLVVMGATAQPVRSKTSIGAVADRVLRECPVAVLAVKTRRPMPATPPDESAGAQAISILVDRWFAENTFEADEFAELDHLLTLKRAQGVTISLALPALNEEQTVGKVIRTLHKALVRDIPLLDEIVLLDSSSEDRTREIAAGLDIPVFIHQEILPDMGPRHGKGEALWKSLLVTRGDIVAWIDTDIVNIHPRFVYGILGPLLLDPKIQFVKGFYRRPLRVSGKLQAGGGGRVTELTARPLLNLFYPELSGIVQPLSGEYAGRREALEALPFFSGYGVETGLLIDVMERYGLAAIAQVDLLERVHHNQPLEALGKMSFAIIQAVIRKLESRYGRPMLEEVNKTMKLIRHGTGGYFLEVEEIAEGERPPMLEVEAYRKLPWRKDTGPAGPQTV
jgi:glucosyl-3-phosphoglycerate synthase